MSPTSGQFGGTRFTAGSKRDRDEGSWHWVHWAPAQQRWTCACAQGRRCSHVEHVHQDSRDRELWRAV